jgi:hypothetical protein
MEGDLNLDAQLKVQLYVVQKEDEDSASHPIDVDGVSIMTAGSTKDGRAYLVLDTAPIIIEAKYTVKQD